MTDDEGRATKGKRRRRVVLRKQQGTPSGRPRRPVASTRPSAVDGRPRRSVPQKQSHRTAPRRRRKWRRWLVVLGVTVIVASVLVSSHALWLPIFGRYLVVADPIQQADAVAVLAGGEKRAAYAARLFNAGYADWFVATDPPLRGIPGIRESHGELVRREALWQGVPEAKVLIAPGPAETTYEEALAVRRMAQEHGWNVLLVVTDPFHARRARKIFRDVLGETGMSVVLRPVNTHWYQPDAWWRHRDSLRETWTEYSKLGLYLLGYR